MSNSFVIRVTNKLYNGGAFDTKIYKRTWYGSWVTVHHYQMIPVEKRTIGVRENPLMASVAKEYGDFIGYAYIFKKIK